MVRCADVLDIRDGTHDSPKYVLEGYPLITSKNIKNGNIEFDNINYITKDDFNKINIRSKVDNGDILMPMIGTIGNPVIVNTERPFAIKNVALFKFQDCGDFCNKYVYYALKSPMIVNQLNRNKRGGTQSFVSLGDIRDLKILNIDIEIQQKIVTILDKAQSLIDKRKEQIEACDELVKSLFYEMFGDPITNANNLPTKPLGEICNMKAGKGIKAKDIYQVCEEQMYPCYGGNGLRGYVESYTHEGAIPLIGRQGALCGNVKYATGKFYATEHAVVTQPIIPMNTMWLYIMLMEMNLNRLATGAAQPGLNVSTLVPLEVIVPDLILQNKFAAQVEKIEHQKQRLEQSLKELENNFNSLMQRAFKGELF